MSVLNAYQMVTGLSMKDMLQLSLITLSLVTVTSVMTIYLSGHSKAVFDPPPSESQTVQNTYTDTRYTELDAITDCHKKAVDKFEGELLRSTVDDHSTRYDPDREKFIIVLYGAIGTPQKNEAARIYCYVEPDSQKVTYFSAYDANNKSLLSGSGFGLLQSLFEEF